MKFLLAFLFFTELFFVGFHLGNAHFGREYGFLPAPGLPEQQLRLLSEKQALETRAEEIKKQADDPLIRGYELKRELELEKLKLAKEIANLDQIIKRPEQDENGKYTTTHKITLPTVLNNYHETFIRLNPEYGIKWFGNFFQPGSFGRILFFLPLLFFPAWLIFSALRKLSARSSSESDFNSLVKKGLTDKALRLWNSGAVQHNFKKQADSLQKKWFHLLRAATENERALEWGCVLYHKNPSDRSFAREFGAFILQECRVVDLKYANLYADLLSEKSNPELAMLIIQEGLLKYPDAALEEGVLRLAGVVQKICPVPELARMLKERNVPA